MDSGNSGSMQSSSGGDEEYDSRAESISAFLNPTAHIGPPPAPQPPHHHLQTSTTTPMFDPLSNYFYPISRPPFPNPNSLLNVEPVWSKTPRSEPNCTQINSILTPPSSAGSVQPFMGHFTAASSSSSPTVPFPPVTGNNANHQRASSLPTSDHTLHVARNPKKRSRASRRAPTTVLTTDTTNFRAMVQEFTGIPAPPFASSPFHRSRLDLFGTPSSIRSNPLDPSQQPPPYLLRPFALKVQPPPYLSASMADPIASTSTNMQNPILTFQSLLQSANLGSKTQESFEIPSNQSNLKMGILDEFVLSHAQINTHIGGVPNLVSANQAASMVDRDNNRPSWADGVGSSNEDQDHHHLRSVNGNYDFSQNRTNSKLNYSASSSNFHGEKGSENVSARGEGMVESWICSSD